MSKVDDLRAFRVAKFNKGRQGVPASAPVKAKPVAVRPVPVLPATVAPVVPAATVAEAVKVFVPVEPVMTPLEASPAVPAALTVPTPPVLPVADLVVSSSLAAPPATPPDRPVPAGKPTGARGRPASGDRPLQPLLEAGLLSVGDTLHGKYKGAEYQALVGAGGVVVVDGVNFDNPSRAGLAAMASTRASLNGWDFWRTSPQDGSRLLRDVRADANRISDPTP